MMLTSYTAVKYCLFCCKIHKVLLLVLSFMIDNHAFHCFCKCFTVKSYNMKGIFLAENRQLLGAVNGIDVLLQCLSVSYSSS